MKFIIQLEARLIDLIFKFETSKQDIPDFMKKNYSLSTKVTALIKI